MPAIKYTQAFLGPVVVNSVDVALEYFFTD